MAEALAIDRALANSVGIADTLIKQASVAIHLGEYEQARALIAESLGIAREVGAEWIISMALARLGLIALRQGNLPQAETPLLEGLARAQESGIRRWSRWYLVGLAEIARLRGMADRAAQLLGASEGGLSAAGAGIAATSQAIEEIPPACAPHSLRTPLPGSGLRAGPWPAPRSSPAARSVTPRSATRRPVSGPQPMI